MEDQTVIELTEIESPVDPKIRQWLVNKHEEYLRRVIGEGKDWEKIRDFKEKHDQFEDFRYDRYKDFLTQTLLRLKPGEKMNIGNAFIQLESALRASDATVDEKVFINCCRVIHRYSTGDFESETE